MSRLLLLFVALWVLVATPVLCVGGALLHPCECGETCGHEEVCDTDPCADVASPTPTDGKLTKLTGPAFEPAPHFVDGESFPPPAAMAAYTRCRHESPNLPLFSSSLPRLL